MSNTQVQTHILDAENKILGKIATEAATLLIGKNKTNYAPNLNVGDKVVIVNSDKIAVTGNKELKKVYHRHTGFPGGVKSQKLQDFAKKDSTKVLKAAISGMLPKNKLRKERLANLRIFKGVQNAK